MNDCRELTVSEAIAHGLPTREPVHPFEELVWFSNEAPVREADEGLVLAAVRAILGDGGSA